MMNTNLEEVDMTSELNRCLSSEKPLQASEDYEIFIATTKIMLKQLEADAAERSVPDMLEHELVILKFTLENEANSPEQVKSLNAAVEEIMSCQRSFSKLVKDPEEYKQAAQEMLY